MKKIDIVTCVERTPCTSLQGMSRVSRTEVRLPAGIEWERMAVNLHAQLTISDKVENKCTVWTAKLVFRTPLELGDLDRYVYRCRMLDGRYRIIGSDERPYPVASIVENLPEKVSDYHMDEVTVTWQSPRFIPYMAE